MKTTAIVRFDGTCVLLHPDNGGITKVQLGTHEEMSEYLCDNRIAPDIWHMHQAGIRKGET